MSIPLHPSQLAAMYDCLREFPPFKKWKLPPGDEVEFHVLRTRAYYGDHSRWDHGAKAGTHVIRVSRARVGHFNTLAQVVAHEMVHMRQRQNRTETPNTQHNAEFWGIANNICAIHGWDERVF